MLYLLGAGALGALYAVIVERHWWVVRRHVVPCLPPSMPSLRVLHLSDLHFRRGQRSKRRFLATLPSEAPDVVVVTGDFLGDRHSADSVVEALSPISARVAKLFVLGSNDYYSPIFKSPLRYLWRRMPAMEPGKHRHRGANPWDELVRRLTEDGWTFLNNRAAHVGEEPRFEVVGLDDAHIGRAQPNAAPERADDGFRLAIAHSPDSAKDLIAKDYDLVLCGHTHGGQVRLPGYGALVTNSAIPRDWARGLHAVGRTWLHVSAGLGTSMFAPYRFSCRPEVSVLDLVQRS